MPKFGDVILSLSGKAGIKQDDENLKKLLALPEVSMFDLPDELANALERNLLTQESAAANPDVRAKIYAEALNGVDAIVDRSLSDFEFDDTFKGEIKGIKNSYDKLNKVNTGLKEQLKAAKEKAKSSGNAQDKAEVTALQNQINELNQQQSNLKRAHEIEMENLRAANLNERKEFTLKSTLAAKPLPKNGLPADVNILTAKTLIQQEMAKHGLIVNFDEAGNPVLLQRKEGAETKYFVDNKPVDYSSFIDGVLASNKFVQINDQQQQQQGTGNNGSFQQQPGVLSNPTLAAESASKLSQLGIGTQV